MAGNIDILVTVADDLLLIVNGFKVLILEEDGTLETEKPLACEMMATITTTTSMFILIPIILARYWYKAVT